MNDHDKTKEQLISEIKSLRKEFNQLNKTDNELHYRELFENHAFLVYSTDIKGNILLANEKAAKFMGYTKETIIGRSFFELRPDRADMYQNVIDTIVATG
jgi:PAS domain S-box-containing protein